MRFIDTNIDPQALTGEQIRKIVEGEFAALATECGELTPDAVDHTEWLVLHPETGRLAIAGFDDRRGPRLIYLATIDVGVTESDIDDECKKRGVDQNADDFDAFEITKDLFKARCDARDVAVLVGGRDCLLWGEAWEKQIVELIAEHAQEGDGEQEGDDD
jgi:hypothetical protein